MDALSSHQTVAPHGERWMDNHGNVDTTDDECVIDDTILSLN